MRISDELQEWVAGISLGRQMATRGAGLALASPGLLGLPPHEKYATTMERVLEATRVYLPAEQAYAQEVQLGWHVLANYVVRNADCHSKNIALYYTQRSDVAFTPVYDIVTTQAYPRYATNPPGLSVDGRKVWAPGKSLEKFFKSRLGISPRDYAAMVEQLCDSAVAVGREMIEVSKNETRWRDITAQMLHAWNDGMASLRSVRSETSSASHSAIRIFPDTHAALTR